MTWEMKGKMVFIKRSLAGRTIRWTFEDGPTAGRTYEHEFLTDGTLNRRFVGALAGDGPSSALDAENSGIPYASFEVAPDVHLVSFLSESGYTLTVTLNFETLHCSGVASNAEEWYPSTGSVEVMA